MTEYLVPATVQEAAHMLAAHGGEALVLAGGTDVLPDVRRRKRDPRCLVDITRIPELARIEVTDRYVQVGAAITFATLKENDTLRRHVPALVEAAGSVGAIAIQTAATWVGNIVQAMPAADGAIVAIALDAEARILDDQGAVWRPVHTLFEGPGRSVVDSTRQIITHLRFPIPETAWGTAWRRIGRRPSLVLPILNCAVKLVLRDECIEQAAVALGPVAPTPFRAVETERLLTGKVLSADVLEKAAQIAVTEAHPRSSVMRASREYRLAVLPVMVGEALTLAAQRARTTAAPLAGAVRAR
jgi:CO/xanthine dehydrogenase FAD-binding subunit